MKESDRFETTQVMKAFLAATELQTKWEFPYFLRSITDILDGQVGERVIPSWPIS